MKKRDVYFYERQRMCQWWMWLVLIGVNVVLLTGIVVQIVFHKPYGNNPMSDPWLIISSVLILLLTVFLLRGSLQTYINKEGVFVKYFPFHFRYKFYDWNTIHASYIVKYNPIREYGGWGVRTGMDVGKWGRFRIGMNVAKAYTTSGNRGLQLVLKNGKKVLIGTHQAGHLETVLIQLDKMERMNDG